MSLPVLTLYCSEGECRAEVHAKGLCQIHYMRHRRAGLLTNEPRRLLDVVERFLLGVHRRGPDECWPWKDRTDTDGYGLLSVGRRGEVRTVLTHRLAYFLDTGQLLPSDVFVCHTCDNPPCCNPAHLFAGSALDNSGDMRAKGRSAAGEKNTQAKLTAEQVMAIRACAYGRTYESLGREFGISPSMVYRIVHRLNWRHLP